MDIQQKLVASVISGLKALYGQDVPAAQVQLQKTKKEFEGHLTLVVFPFLRMSKKGGKRAFTRGQVQRHQGLPEPHHCFVGMDRAAQRHSG